MNTLIIKLNAIGDVVRTTTLLRVIDGDVTWITDPANTILLRNLVRHVRVLSWSERSSLLDERYDLVINLEDDMEVCAFAATVPCERLYGARKDGETVTYGEDAQAWFDLSLVSRFGRAEADRLKYQNRRSYQSLVFEGLGHRFSGETYLLPAASPTDLFGDVAIAAVAGAVWPMKAWAHYGALRDCLRARGLVVNDLPKRASILEHIADVSNHRCVVSGDSLPMHIALGTGTRCVTIFNCTSPWEIHDYGLQTQIISPLLGEFFYKRSFDARATHAIPLAKVEHAVLAALEAAH